MERILVGRARPWDGAIWGRVAALHVALWAIAALGVAPLRQALLAQGFGATELTDAGGEALLEVWARIPWLELLPTLTRSFLIGAVLLVPARAWLVRLSKGDLSRPPWVELLRVSCALLVGRVLTGLALAGTGLGLARWTGQLPGAEGSATLILVGGLLTMLTVGRVGEAWLACAASGSPSRFWATLRTTRGALLRRAVPLVGISFGLLLARAAIALVCGRVVLSGLFFGQPRYLGFWLAHLSVFMSLWLELWLFRFAYAAQASSTARERTDGP